MDTEIRKAQILKISTDIFLRDGYEKASLREIAEKAGFTKAAIYYHFKNKEEILFNILNNASDQLISDLVEIDRREIGPVEKLREMLTKQISYMERDKASPKILIADSHFLGKKHQEIIRNKQRKIFEIYRTKLEEIATIGSLKDINFTTGSFSVLGSVNWLYHWYKPKGKLTIGEITDNIIKSIFYGLIENNKERD